mmetsp:Transcript_77091/g.136013  ORF Transcript_77091/g.136013 Transcript_77091/m.136013 type:complete len:205 (+) Transcript_77091:3808-4422(+)
MPPSSAILRASPAGHESIFTTGAATSGAGALCPSRISCRCSCPFRKIQRPSPSAMKLPPVAGLIQLDPPSFTTNSSLELVGKRNAFQPLALGKPSTPLGARSKPGGVVHSMACPVFASAQWIRGLAKPVCASTVMPPISAKTFGDATDGSSKSSTERSRLFKRSFRLGRFRRNDAAADSKSSSLSTSRPAESFVNRSTSRPLLP